LSIVDGVADEAEHHEERANADKPEADAPPGCCGHDTPQIDREGVPPER
jgi:hypothetical protein